MDPLEVDFLPDGGQTALEVTKRLSAFLGDARQSLDVAIYDFHAREGATAGIADALEAAAARGVAVRVAFNVERKPAHGHVTPMTAAPEVIDGLEVPTKGIHDQGSLMHHKYVVRDAAAVWTGSTNWTDDAFTREENSLIRVASAEIAAAYSENFTQLWEHGNIERSGGAGSVVSLGAGITAQPLFSPRGPSLAHRAAERIAAARRRVRVASPVYTSGAVLGTLAELAGRKSFDLRGAYDATQMLQVEGQWRDWPPNHWKIEAWHALRPRLEGKVTTPYAPGAVHDYMHAKIVVADDEVVTGSYNLSHGGEENAENVLHIVGEPIAVRFAAFVDQIADRYREKVQPAGPG
jgi:phosphatidylserine/phosphatidylglycerophosphate/cardiolipin synthase-like enzyme